LHTVKTEKSILTTSMDIGSKTAFMAIMKWEKEDDFIEYDYLVGIMKNDPDDLEVSSDDEEFATYNLYLDLCQKGIGKVLHKNWYKKVIWNKIDFVEDIKPRDEAYILLMYKQYACQVFMKKIGIGEIGEDRQEDANPKSAVGEEEEFGSAQSTITGSTIDETEENSQEEMEVDDVSEQKKQKKTRCHLGTEENRALMKEMERKIKAARGIGNGYRKKWNSAIRNYRRSVVPMNIYQQVESTSTQEGTETEANASSNSNNNSGESILRSSIFEDLNLGNANGGMNVKDILDDVGGTANV